jgi:hypothetical protein
VFLTTFLTDIPLTKKIQVVKLVSDTIHFLYYKYPHLY